MTEAGRIQLLLVHGPNLNLLGERNPAVYGTTVLADYERRVRDVAAARQADVARFQSNHEGAIVDFVQERRRQADGLLINAGAFTHTSVALRDVIEAIEIPAVEIHISNVHAREPFRHVSYLSDVCIGQVAGLGFEGYTAATNLLLDYLDRKDT